ncbi:hypothetical protein [Mesorhizobium sp. WSM3626]|uniref:hypothetical protein n=1 Tax=Mesorhizobium sp. WSM3626 TaxID=1040987 RepID=UPI001FD8C7AB|nr:hypothetical protein [Mesorhizobium sp. WSM3626]
MAAWLGLVSREYSTGCKQKLLDIRKRATDTSASSWFMEHDHASVIWSDRDRLGS